MAGKKSDVLYRRRGQVLNYARDLARSGEHADHQTIIPLMIAREDFAVVRRWFEDRAFCVQLDKLCTMARRAAA